jgi:NAD(P)-dependent dehydrogenase (short-subunit alcohol dehydrogenase family)
MAHHFIQATNGTGTIINFISLAAALIVPGLSSYSISKLAAIRLGEYIHAGKFYPLQPCTTSPNHSPENPNIRVFSVHPGIVEVENGRGMFNAMFEAFANDKALLSGGVTLYLATPKAEHLRGNYFSVNWDVVELEEHKAEFVEKKLGLLGFLNGTNADGTVGTGGYKWAAKV